MNSSLFVFAVMDLALFQGVYAPPEFFLQKNSHL